MKIPKAMSDLDIWDYKKKGTLTPYALQCYTDWNWDTVLDIGFFTVDSGYKIVVCSADGLLGFAHGWEELVDADCQN